MTRVFVYEYLSGGGLEAGDPATRAALLPAGVAMRDAMVADLLRVPDCDLTVAMADGGGQPPGRVACVSPAAGETPFDFVERASRGHDHVWLVAPETGGLLGQFERHVGAPRWLVCSAEAIALCSSKRATTLHLAWHGVATPLAFEHDPLTQRWVTKPDDGAGAIATWRHADRSAARDDWARRGAGGEAVVMEPWVDGDALSLSLMCGRDGIELLSVNRQDIAVDAAGRVSFEGVALDRMAPSEPRRVRLERLARQVAGAVPGLRGFVGIDLVWHAQAGPVVIEINPRVTCAYVGLSAALGRNLAAAAVAAHARSETAADAAR